MVLTKGTKILLKVAFSTEAIKTQIHDIDSGGVQVHLLGSAVAENGSLHTEAKGKGLADALRDPILYIPFSQIHWIAEYGE